nr:uncharacterized protein LOC127338282 [Lolium perenne]
MPAGHGRHGTADIICSHHRRPIYRGQLLAEALTEEGNSRAMGSGDWGPVLIAVLFFVVLTPGLLCQIPGNDRRVAEFHSMRTSYLAIFVHTVIFFGFCAIFMVAVGVHLSSG